jgi:hypothetical protein
VKIIIKAPKKMSTKYYPVDPDYHDMIFREMSEKETAVIHYFEEDNSLGNHFGKIKDILQDENHEEFVVLHSGEKVRIDRIIVLNGKPGPAYDEYDSYALACLDCMGGMD